MTHRRRACSRTNKALLLLLMVGVVVAIAGCSLGTGAPTPGPAGPSEPAAPDAAPVSATLTVSFIDVGQADSILIRTGDAAMLIDGGNNADADAVVAYLTRAGVKKLDLVVGTHPHEDHIGGLDAVINAFPVDRVCLPRVTATTRTFEDLLLAIKGKGLTIESPAPDSEFELGEAHGVFLAPRRAKYTDVNNYSLVIRLTFGNTSFLLMGDAGRDAEDELLAAGVDLAADVLKVAHHGSSTSTSAAFLGAVDPRQAVISVGKDNNYGHPHRETLERLNKRGIAVYRTDAAGTIVAASDGKTVSFDVSPIR